MMVGTNLVLNCISLVLGNLSANYSGSIQAGLVPVIIGLSGYLWFQIAMTTLHIHDHPLSHSRPAATIIHIFHLTDILLLQNIDIFILVAVAINIVQRTV